MKKIVLPVMLLLCLLNGCRSSNDAITPSIEEIVSIDFIYVDPYHDERKYESLEAAYTIPEKHWSDFIEEFNKIPRKWYYSDPLYEISGTVIRITYTDESYQIISPWADLRIGSDGVWRYKTHYFDKDAFHSFVSAYWQ